MTLINAPWNFDFEIWEGATLNYSFYLYNKDDGSDHDCSVYTSIDYVIKTDRNAATTSASLDLADGISVSGANNSKLTCTKTLGLNAGRYVYDIVGTKADGTTVPLAYGKIKIHDTAQ